MRRFLLLATALFLLLVIGLPCAALYSVLFTQSGLQFVARPPAAAVRPRRHQDRGRQRHDRRWRARRAGRDRPAAGPSRDPRHLHAGAAGAADLADDPLARNHRRQRVHRGEAAAGPPSAPAPGPAVPATLADHRASSTPASTTRCWWYRTARGSRAAGIDGSALLRHRDIRFYRAAAADGRGALRRRRLAARRRSAAAHGEAARSPGSRAASPHGGSTRQCRGRSRQAGGQRRHRRSLPEPAERRDARSDASLALAG